MSERRRGERKEVRKDQQVRREVLGELGSEITQARTWPNYRNPNRDQARGDWDRSRRLADEASSLEEGAEGDEGLESQE